LEDCVIDSRWVRESFLFSIELRPALWASQCPILAVLSLGVKREGREADKPSPISAEVKNDGAVPHLVGFQGVMLN
jgi:hypothetical protein